MGKYRPLKTSCWESLLKSLGYAYSRTEGSHDLWTKKASRTIPVWGKKKEIPAFHLNAICKTIGWKMDDIYKWAEKNC